MAIETLDTGRGASANVAALERLADASGDAAYRRAARALAAPINPKTGGRPAMNDTAAINAAVEMAANRRAPSLAEAFRRVAVARGIPPEGVRAAVERYRRKRASAVTAEKDRTTKQF